MHESEKHIPLLVTRYQAAELIRACQMVSNQYHKDKAFWAAQDLHMLALQIKTQMEEGV